MTRDKNAIFNLPQYRNCRVELRKNPTEPEKRFWQAVRGKQLGTKFRRQHGIGQYIVDFYSPEWSLVVELDGDSHFNAGAQAADAKRDAYLRNLGLRVLRFTNLDIMQNLDGVLLRIMESNPTPTLPLSGEGAKPPGDIESREKPSSFPREGGDREGENASPYQGKDRERGNSSPCEGENRERGNSSPCEGGGREGVAPTNSEVGDART